MHPPLHQNRAASSPPSSFISLLISDGVRSTAVRNPSKPALMIDSEVRTYREFVSRMNKIINAAAEDLNLGPGDHVAILARNRFEFMEVMVGISDLGVAVATPSPSLTAIEVNDILLDCEAQVVFTEPELVDLINADALPKLHKIMIFGAEFEAWIDQASDRPRKPLADEWTTFSIPYTSGTTGKPKGVLVPHRARTLNIYAMAVEYGCYGPDHHFLGTTPMCHGAGFTMLYASLFFGGTGEFIRQYDVEHTLEKLHRGNATGVFLVPSQFHKIFNLDDRTLEKYRGTQLRSIISNAAPLQQSSKERIVEYFGSDKLFECYGSTEAGIVSNLRPADQLRKQKCVGHPFFSTSVKLLDEDRNEVKNGEVGELFATGPSLFNGYWNRAEETTAAFYGDWVTVGDMAVKDDEGYIYIVDRKKDMVISGGVNVYPREIEEVISELSGVTEVAVVGVEDAQWGEKLVAHIVLRNGANLTAPEIKKHCSQSLAGFKIPKEVMFETELPRNPAGKVLKRELKNRIKF
ncbi:MAG: class I adenylate-forming enzyme family protein [Rhodospirillaceae bacterium]